MYENQKDYLALLKKWGIEQGNKMWFKSETLFIVDFWVPIQNLFKYFENFNFDSFGITNYSEFNIVLLITYGTLNSTR